MKFKKFKAGHLCAVALVVGLFGYFYCLQLPVVRLQYELPIVKAKHPAGNEVQKKLNKSLGLDLPTNSFESIEVAYKDRLALQAMLAEQTKKIALLQANMGIMHHPFRTLDKNIFYTQHERMSLFTQLGLRYLNDMEFEGALVAVYDARISDMYLADRAGHDALTNLYAESIAQKTLIAMSIRWLGSEIGHGVFAEQDVLQGDFIGVYGGVVRDRALVNNRDYAWAYPGATLQGNRLILDGIGSGNELRFMNDGKTPNCMVKYIVGSDNIWHVCYVAAKAIKKGEQLLISYGPAYWDTRKYAYQELTELHN